jgi:hypothetical protein
MTMSSMIEPDEAAAVVKDCCAPGRAAFLTAAPDRSPADAATPATGDDEC